MVQAKIIELLQVRVSHVASYHNWNKDKFVANCGFTIKASDIPSDIATDLYTDNGLPPCFECESFKEWGKRHAAEKLNTNSPCSLIVVAEGPGLPVCGHNHKRDFDARKCAELTSTEKGLRYIALTLSEWRGYCDKAVEIDDPCACRSVNHNCRCFQCRRWFKGLRAETLVEILEIIKGSTLNEVQHEDITRAETLMRREMSEGNGYVRLPHEIHASLKEMAAKSASKLGHVAVEWRTEETQIYEGHPKIFPQWSFSTNRVGGVSFFEGRYSANYDEGDNEFLVFAMIFASDVNKESWVADTFLPKILQKGASSLKWSGPNPDVTWKGNHGCYVNPEVKGEIYFEIEKAGPIIVVTATDTSDGFQIGTVVTTEGHAHNWATMVVKLLRKAN